MVGRYICSLCNQERAGNAGKNGLKVICWSCVQVLLRSSYEQISKAYQKASRQELAVKAELLSRCIKKEVFYEKARRVMDRRGTDKEVRFTGKQGKKPNHKRMDSRRTKAYRNLRY